MAVRTNGQEHHLTREEAIKLHRELWDRIAKECEQVEVESLDTLAWIYGMERDDIKAKHIRDMGYYYADFECFACDYAQHQRDINGRVEYKCSYCPFDWNANSCLSAGYEFMKATDVRDLPEKEE